MNVQIETLNKSNRMSLVKFVIVTAVTLFLYFEVVTQIWFVSLLRGFLIKVWIPPLLLLFYVIMKKLKKGEHRLNLDKLDFMLVFYAIFGLIAMLLNEEPYFAIKYYLIMIAPVWYYVVILSTFRSNKDIEKFIHILLLCSFLWAVYTHIIGQQLTSSNKEVITQTIVTSAGNVIGLGEAQFSHGGQIYHRGIMFVEDSKYCGMLTPGILFSILFFLQTRKKIRYLYLAMSAFIMYQMTNSLSRTGLVSAFAGILMLGISLSLYDKKKKKQYVFAFLFIIGIYVSYLALFKTVFLLRLFQLLNIFQIQWIDDFLREYGILTFSTDFYDPHYISIFDGFKAFLENPFFGSGHGYTEIIIFEHNRYLFILFSAGLFTVIPYIIFFFGWTTVVKRWMPNYKNFQSNGIHYGHFFLACCVMSLVKLLNEGMETFFYWILFALAAAWINNATREQAGVAMNVKNGKAV